MSVLKKILRAYVLGLLFLAVYETVRVSLDLGEFRFVGPMFLNQPVNSLVVLSFVAGLISTRRYFLVGFLYFIFSPFVVWMTMLFRGPHENLFKFYYLAWSRFDAHDLTALILACVVIWAIAHVRGRIPIPEFYLGTDLD